MLQRYLLKRLVRLAHVDSVLAHVLDLARDGASLVDRLGLDGAGLLCRGAGILVGFVEEGHVVVVGSHLARGGAEGSRWAEDLRCVKVWFCSVEEGDGKSCSWSCW